MPTRSGKNFAAVEAATSVGPTPSSAVASGQPQRATKRTQRLVPISAEPHSQPSRKRQKKSSASTSQPPPATNAEGHGNNPGRHTTARQEPGRAQPLQDDADEAESDSRYALSRRQPGRARNSRRPAAQLGAELLIEEQEEIQPGARATNATSSTNIEPNTARDERHDSLSDIDAQIEKQRRTLEKQKRTLAKQKKKARKKEAQKLALAQQGEQAHEEEEQEKALALELQEACAPEPKQKTSWAPMFTVAEAIAALARDKDNTASRPTIAYDLPTGAFITYPVTRSYHLGAMGRYGVATAASE